jgi:hypothetical protein
MCEPADMATSEEEKQMWLWVGIGGALYIILMISLGLMTLRNGHGWMFFFGFFLPLLWLIGAFMQPPRDAYA